MEWNLKTTGIVIGIFFIGYIIGLVEAAIKQKSKDKKKAHLEEKEEIDLSLAPLKQPNLFSINRDPSKALVLELEGQTISNKDELTPDNKRLLVNLMVEVRPWLETTISTPMPPQTETQPEQIFIQPQTASPSIPSISTLLLQSTPVPSTESIVSQIDTVLQNRLAASPLANQGIRLQESPTGGVRVYVGLNRFDGIDAIPDPEIKAFIRQAVAEWERQA
jgi:hypothetical protein